MFDTIAPDRRDDPELGKMRADDVDHRGLLANKQMTGTVQRQAALLLWRLGRDEMALARRVEEPSTASTADRQTRFIQSLCRHGREKSPV
ncbi:MAG: hypothetical protein WCD52_20475 [Xanthobacteraceae bacterium]